MTHGVVSQRTNGPGHHSPRGRRRWLTAIVLAVGVVAGTPAFGAAPSADVREAYAREIHPLLVKTCGQCHGRTPKDNDLDLTAFTTAAAIVARPEVLEAVAGRLREGDMPPKEAPQPTAAEREQLLAWIAVPLDAEADARAGDPGPVTLRRLTNPAYDNAVRDLTGIDMKPTRAREFPVDGVGGEGFANVGDAMPMTPGLFERYLQTARDVAARVVLLPTGIRFSAAPDRPVWTDEALTALRGFHDRHAGPNGEPALEKHLVATMRNRDRLATGGQPAIAALAAQDNLNPVYLTALWMGLSGTTPSPLLDAVRDKWRAATSDPKPVLQQIKATQAQLFLGNYKTNAVLAVGNGFPAWEEIRRVVGRARVEGFARDPEFRLISRQVDAADPWAGAAGPHPAPPFVIWDSLRLEGGDGPPLILAEHEDLRIAVEQASGLQFGHHPQGRPVPKSALVIPAGAEVLIRLRTLPASLLQALTLPRFIRADVSLDAAAPDMAAVQAFLIASTGGGGPTSEPVPTANAGDRRTPVVVPARLAAERARPAAEFRALFPPAVLFAPIIPRDAQGSLFMYHREDEPLRRLLLDDAGRAELDRLWSELRFVSLNAFATPRMYEEIVQYYRRPNDNARIMFFVIQEFAHRVRKEKADLAAALAAAEPRHLDALLAFAARAWRRPLAAAERQALLDGYRAVLNTGIGHDEAFRDALARVLSSPWFLYRVESPAAGPRWRPVTGDELASRLSFMLWDSIPDEELRAAAGRLHEPAVMEAQVRRMLADGRIHGMAAEFGARWLGVHDFATNHGRSLEHFPEFTPALRDALAEEPIRLFEDLLVNDRHVADLIDADAVIVNEVLAKHYGIPDITGPEWRRVENVASRGRGGLLGLGAVLARQSAAARTSPVKRGAWVVQMLGERLPKVPADVPPLPETPPPGLSVRAMTERHRQDAACAGCHDRIDPFGLALEQFDALGRLRPGGDLEPDEASATLRDGTVLDGFRGLQTYVAGPRREDLLNSLARKLTGYALGRSVELSDRRLVGEVATTMVGGGRWSDALLVIAESEQFRSIRPASSPRAAPAAMSP